MNRKTRRILRNIIKGNDETKTTLEALFLAYYLEKIKDTITCSEISSVISILIILVLKVSQTINTMQTFAMICGFCFMLIIDSLKIKRYIHNIFERDIFKMNIKEIEVEYVVTEGMNNE